VAHILENREYTGCLVNFKTENASYKVKQSRENPEEKQVIFENHHEPIIDRDTWERVQELRKRRNAAKKKELEAAEKRIAELSAIFKRLYEDSVAGRISDERCMELSADYEAEQKVTDTVNQLKIGKMVFNWLTVFRV
jgi:phosphoenolpyruvate-protein kinase (PTS system EI component)